MLPRYTHTHQKKKKVDSGSQGWTALRYPVKKKKGTISQAYMKGFAFAY